MDDIRKKAIKFEIMLGAFLKEEYPHVIANPTIKKEDKIIRPDMIISKNKKSYFVEIKLGRFIPGAVLNKLQFYQENLNTEYGYLAVYDDGFLKKSGEKLFLENGFGIIKFNENKIIDIKKPVKNKKIIENKSFDSLTIDERRELEIGQNVREQEEIKAKLDYTTDEIKKFPITFIIYIIFGGLLLFSLSKIIEILFDKNLWAYISISAILIIGIGTWYFHNKKNDKKR